MPALASKCPRPAKKSTQRPTDFSMDPLQRQAPSHHRKAPSHNRPSLSTAPHHKIMWDTKTPNPKLDIEIVKCIPHLSLDAETAPLNTLS